MDIAGMSMLLSQAKVKQQASLSVMKIAMDTSKQRVTDLVQMLQQNNKALEQAVQPHLGSNIDIRL